MLFNSLEFLIFAPIALAVSALLRGWLLKTWLIGASYVFYGWAQPSFCLLLLVSTTVDFFAAQGVARFKQAWPRRLCLLGSIATNLGLLGYFKYAGFFAQSINALTDAGLPVPYILLPAGISFYTFQTLSYTIDVYRGRLKPTSNFLTMALYVSFFPQLVAGPIERAGHLMAQLDTPPNRTQDDAMAGITRILWGLMKKVVFADWLSFYSRQILATPESFHGWELALAVTCFAYVIYLDFSAYSDIAIGLARCMGIRLRENFKHPYIARNVSEFWRRWHISLSEWLRDYLYFPLGGSRKGSIRTGLNLVIVMFLGGLWHGADWRFVLWGLWHGLGLLIYHAWSQAWPKLQSKLLPSLKQNENHPIKPDGFAPFRIRDVPAIALTFGFVWISWIPFAAQPITGPKGRVEQTGLQTAQKIFDGVFRSTDKGFWGSPTGWEVVDVLRVVIVLAIAILAHYTRALGIGQGLLAIRNPYLIGLFWAVVIIISVLLLAPTSDRFIYFQF